MRKPFLSGFPDFDNRICFSPLAGIRYAETQEYIMTDNEIINVSVPLRGLDMRKLFLNNILFQVVQRFSPLAGIRYAETKILLSRASKEPMFQSPCGD